MNLLEFIQENKVLLKEDEMLRDYCWNIYGAIRDFKEFNNTKALGVVLSKWKDCPKELQFDDITDLASELANPDRYISKLGNYARDCTIYILLNGLREMNYEDAIEKVRDFFSIEEPKTVKNIYTNQKKIHKNNECKYCQNIKDSYLKEVKKSLEELMPEGYQDYLIKVNTPRGNG
jgi:hypothetical protein